MRQQSLKEWHSVARSDWPETIQECVLKAERQHIDPKLITALHTHYYGDFLMVVDDTEALLKLMIAQWKLVPVNRDHKLVQFVRTRISSAISVSEEDDDNSYYVSRDWLEGEKGHQFCVIRNPRQERIVVRYWYNF